MVTDILEGLLRDALVSACAAGELTLPSTEVHSDLSPPRNRQFGDFASNLALLVAGPAQLSARQVATVLVNRLALEGTVVDHVEIAGPGFINFHLRPDWLHDILVAVEARDADYGSNRSHGGQRILIEFVSANPTGPISVVNGRAAALGDALRRLLQASGAHVETEFYVNDALNSTQLNLLGDSLAARYLQQLGIDAQVPEDGYLGEYVTDMAKDLLSATGGRYADLPPAERSALFRQTASERMVAKQRADLETFGVVFDHWFFESSLYSTGAVHAAIDLMRERGYAYEKDGAVWLRSTDLAGDDQDRVLVRSNERETYVAADAAYHKGKFDRGFTHLINIWGADHHGYVARLKAGIAALGYNADNCRIILTQMVMLLRDGEPVRGSKRAGDVIPLVDLVVEVGRDAARYNCLLNSYETTATFDLEVAKKQSSENPVYYAQYAHARCASVLRRCEESGLTLSPASAVRRDLLVHEKELDLLRALSEYPVVVRSAADLLAPHRLTTYVRELGQALHQFYEECPALKEGIDPNVRDARLCLFNATRIVVRNLLGLLGVTAPDRM